MSDNKQPAHSTILEQLEHSARQVYSYGPRIVPAEVQRIIVLCELLVKVDIPTESREMFCRRLRACADNALADERARCKLLETARLVVQK